jgi:hypothetical protein
VRHKVAAKSLQCQVANSRDNNPEEVIARLDVKLRTPTPDIESLILPEPRISQIPHNPTKAHSQSTFLKNRIFRHQGSSPTSILGAIDYFKKGAKMIMHKFALQEAELKIFRNANLELTNRRKTKKKQLRKGGLFSFQDARDLQDAQDVNAQIRQCCNPTEDWWGTVGRT